MSWESSAVYYRFLNEIVRERVGGLHSAPCLMHSVDFAPIEQMQREGRWDDAARALADGARSLERGGAELLVLCTNTMHKVADEVAGAVGIPFLHIADATAAAVRAAGHRRVGLLATAYTMEQDFYVGRLRERHGLEVLVPDDPGRAEVHRVIYEELCLGRIVDASRDAYREVMAGLAARGAQAILLGCTEIDLLVTQDDASVPLFDTTRIHAEQAVEMALA
jgi:aspartate racemase